MERLYTIVRNDFSIGYQAAQSGHAVAQWLLDNPNQTWNNNYLIMLQCNNIKKWVYKLEHLNIPFTKFHEPDLDNELTAIAVQADQQVFRNLKKLGD